MPATAFGFIPDVAAATGHKEPPGGNRGDWSGVKAPRAPGQRIVAHPLKDMPRGCKIVHFMRHGMGTHNAAALAHGSGAYRSEDHADALLTEIGEAQAQGAEAYASQLSCPLVIVSPLTRAIQTALFAFGPGHAGQARTYPYPCLYLSLPLSLPIPTPVCIYP